MPGNVVALGTITDAYPASRFKSFSVSYSLAGLSSEFVDGSVQLHQKASQPRRRWKVQHRMSLSEKNAMKVFWKAHLTAPFLFTDASSGVTFTAVFTGGWTEERTLGDRYTVSLELLEVA
jgi:hypothetical protein